jgi:hypothetical protein
MKKETTVDQGFVERFRIYTDELKNKYGVPIKSLPESVGFTFQHAVLMNYRSGRNEPQSYIFRELRQKTGVDLNWLICGDPRNEESSPAVKHECDNELNLIQSVGGGDLIKDAKYIRITDNFNAPIRDNSIAVYTETNDYYVAGHYVVSLFDTGVQLVRKIVKINSSTYKIVPGSEAAPNIEGLTISHEEIKFHGKVLVILSKSD